MRTWHGQRDVRVDTVPDPAIQDPTDVIVEVTSTGICGSDLHLYEVLAVHEPGDILGHEPMGVVGGRARGHPHAAGDRVVVPFNISCGTCFMCTHRSRPVRDDPGPRVRQGRGAVRLHEAVRAGARAARRSSCVPHAHSAPIKVPDEPARRALRLPVRRAADRLAGRQYADVPAGGTLAVLGLGPIGDMATRCPAPRASRDRRSTWSPSGCERATAQRRRPSSTTRPTVDDVERSAR